MAISTPPPLREERSILKDDILRDENFLRINSKKSSDVVSGVNIETNYCFLCGTTDSFLRPPAAD